MKKTEIVAYPEVENRLVVIRGHAVMADADVAALYGVKTREVNQAVSNNPDKFPADYMFPITRAEQMDLRFRLKTTMVSRKSRTVTKVFTEKGLYMLATVLKGDRAKTATFEIIETFAKVRGLKRELLELHQDGDKQIQESKLKHFGSVLSDIVMPELKTTETESILELNFIVGKIKHTVKRKCEK